MCIIVCMKKDRVTLTIDPDVRARLERTGNASSYISRTIRERLDAAEASLRVLRIEGWDPSSLVMPPRRAPLPNAVRPSGPRP